MASRAIDLNEPGDELVLDFSYNPALVAVVRGLSRRRFDPVTKHWYCPAEIVIEVVERLVENGFVVSARALALYRERGGAALPAGGGVDGGGAALLTDRPRGAPRVAPGPPPGGSAGDPASLTVSALNARVHHALARAFPELLWVVGEIAGFDRNRHRPHVHFQLMEKAPDSSHGGGSGAGFGGTPGDGGAAAARGAAGARAAAGAIVAEVNAVLFERTRRALERKLAAGPEPFELKDGIEVRLQVRVELYQPRGAYQLVVEDVDPVHTLGRIAQNRAAVLAELEKRGLREANGRLPWPEVPLRVGLITSVGSDAYNDFVNELARSGYAFEITAADARMQGQGLERGLVAALGWFAARADGFDALAIVRGGGAKTDLVWFDNLQVALAVATCPIKIVSGIGHQRDVSVIDLIAHPEKTPTAAAAALAGRVQAFEQRLTDAFARLAGSVRTRVEAERARLSRSARELALGARGVGRLGRERLRAAVRRLAPAARERLRAAARALAEARLRLVSLGRAQARLQQGALVALRRRLSAPALALHLERRGARLAALERLARSLHPRTVVERGFAIVRDAGGKTLRDAAATAPGREIEATLARGRLRARVERADPDPDPGRGEK